MLAVHRERQVEQLLAAVEHEVAAAALGRQLGDGAGLLVDLQEGDRHGAIRVVRQVDHVGDVDAGVVDGAHVSLRCPANVAIVWVCVPSELTRWIVHEPLSSGQSE